MDQKIANAHGNLTEAVLLESLPHRARLEQI
jgi:hypothetical protein